MNRKEFLTYPKLIRFKREDCENEIKKIDISLEKLKDKELDNYNTTCSLLIGCYSKDEHKFSLDITSLNLSVKDLINIVKTTRKRIVKERDFLLMKERDFLINNIKNKIKNMADKLGVALVKYICPICGKEADSAILMNKILSKKMAEEVEKLNGQNIGFSEKPCKECQEWIDKGAFFIIGIDSDKTEDNSNPYRTGHLVGIKKESEFYKDLDDKYKTHDFLFMDYRIMEQIGLINK